MNTLQKVRGPGKLKFVLGLNPPPTHAIFHLATAPTGGPPGRPKGLIIICFDSDHWSYSKNTFFIIPVLNVHNNGPKFVISVQEVLTQWETISYTNRVSQDDMMYEAGPAHRACPGRPTPSHRCRWVSPSGSCSPSASLQGRGSNQRIRIYSQTTQNPAVSGVITNILYWRLDYVIFTTTASSHFIRHELAVV